MGETFGELVTGIINEISVYFITLVAAVSMIVFVWGITTYIYKGDSQEARSKGRNLMIWGLVGFFVMFGVWGILAIIGETFGIEAVIPQFDNKYLPLDGNTDVPPVRMTDGFNSPTDFPTGQMTDAFNSNPTNLFDLLKK